MTRLQWSYSVLKKRFGESPSFLAPWRLVKAKVSLVKTNLSVRFLNTCRRKNVVPDFIRNCSRAGSLFSATAGIHNLEMKFHRDVLSRIIRDKYRAIDSLQRQIKALLAE